MMKALSELLSAIDARFPFRNRSRVLTESRESKDINTIEVGALSNKWPVILVGVLNKPSNS
jgi:hypothetical protein